MSQRQFLTGMAGTVLVAAFLVSTVPLSGADYTTQGDGALRITISVPTPSPPTLPPFDWNWTYPAPTCAGVTIPFPANLPASQQGIMEINVTGGSISGMQYKLEGNAYPAKYPNGHAGLMVFVPWSEFRNYKIPVKGTWTVAQLQVHGTNYHWQGSLNCGQAAAAKAEAPAIAPPSSSDQSAPTEPIPSATASSAVPEPEQSPAPETAQPSPIPTPSPSAQPTPEAAIPPDPADEEKAPETAEPEGTPSETAT